jgi:hypothetical protein
MAISRVFLSPLTWLTAFRSEYLGRQELRTSETVSTGSLPSWSGLALKKRSFDDSAAFVLQCPAPIEDQSHHVPSYCKQ